MLMSRRSLKLGGHRIRALCEWVISCLVILWMINLLRWTPHLSSLKDYKDLYQPSFLNEYFQVWWDKSGSTIVSLGVTDQFQINIIFFHEIKLVQDPISCLNKTNRSSKIPSQIVPFVIKMFLGKEYLMR